MDKIAKILSTFVNLANYAVGIAVAVILIFKKDTIAIFYLKGMSTNESLFFNLVLFQIGLVLVGVVLCLLINEYSSKNIVVEFPTLYMAVPIIISIISIYYGVAGETVREKLFVVIGAIIYSVLSAVIVYCGSRVFQLFPKKVNK